MNDSFFTPKSVCIVGASTTPGKIGNDMLKNLASYSGKKLGINPQGNGKIVHGVPLFNSFADLPITPDIAVFVIPARFVAKSLTECGKKGIKNVVIISAGFKEAGNDFAEKEILQIANQYNIHILGPNCLGFLNPHAQLNLSFASDNGIQKGNITLISQSGAMAVALMDWAQKYHLGFSKIISMGNKAGLNENDFLEKCINDPSTEVIVLYLESISHGKKFYTLAKHITPLKPVIVVKSGISQKGALAASSHTGALSGKKEVLETALKQAGVHSTHSLQEMFLWSEAFSLAGHKPVPQNILMITNAGGPGVMAVDNAELFNISLMTPSQEEKTILMRNMPSASSMKNPLDILGDADSTRYSSILNNIEQLPRFTLPAPESQSFAILILLTPQAVTDTENIAKEIIAFQNKHPDRIILSSFMGGKKVQSARNALQQAGILHFEYPKEALQVFSRLQKQYQWKQQHPTPTPLPENMEFNIPKFSSNDSPQLLPPQETEKIFEQYSIPFAKETLLTKTEDIKQVFSPTIPGVMKISSPDIAHKTDIGGVVLGIKSLSYAQESYTQILKSARKHAPHARINGVIYQPLFPQSREVFIGMTRDKEFGEVMVFGLGGIYVNIFEDVSRRIGPVSESEIETMITEIKSYPLLKGVRGEKSIDFKALKCTMLKLSKLFHSEKQIQEIDINPLFCMEDSVMVMDAKIFV